MDTLLLNHAFQPVERIRWEDAIGMLVRRVAEVVEEYADRLVRSASWTLNMPAVVRLLKPKDRRKRARFSRHNVFLRDKGRCQYCNTKLKLKDATYDHVVPRQQGGLTRWDNVVIACVPCNQAKRNRTPEEAGMHLRTEPVRPRSLPSVPRLKLRGAPPEWEPYIRSYLYMHGELDGDA